MGIDISAGQLSRILTENKDSFHQEKDQLAAGGLGGVDLRPSRRHGDAAPGTQRLLHPHRQRSVRHVREHRQQSQLKFMEVFHRSHSVYLINVLGGAFYERQHLAEAVRKKLCQGPGEFADQAAWASRLQELEITAEQRHGSATEGALLGSLIAHGVSPTLAILSRRGTAVRRVGPCVLLDPCRTGHWRGWFPTVTNTGRRSRRATADLGSLPGSEDLSARSRRNRKKPLLEAAFDALCGERTGFPQYRRGIQGDERSSGRSAPGVGAARDPLAQQPQRRACARLRQKRKISGSTRSTGGVARDTFASRRTGA